MSGKERKVGERYLLGRDVEDPGFIPWCAEIDKHYVFDGKKQVEYDPITGELKDGPDNTSRAPTDGSESER